MEDAVVGKEDGSVVHSMGVPELWWWRKSEVTEDATNSSYLQ